MAAAVVVATFANGVSDQWVGYNAMRSLRDNPAVLQPTDFWRAASLDLVGDRAAMDGGTLVRRPLLSLSFAAQAFLGGTAPRSFHYGNVLIHALATLLLFGVIRRSLDARAPATSNAWIAAAAATLWGVHPLHTESVTYVIQRAESLAGLATLASLYGLRRSIDAGGRRGWLLASIVAGAAAVATKENAVATLPILWLYARTFDGTASTPRWYWLGYAATWLIPLLLLLATAVDASLDFRHDRLPIYVASQPAVWLEYLRLVFWPAPICISVNTGTHILGGGLEPGYALVAGIVVGGGLWLTWRAARARSVAGLLAGSFALLLLPTSLVATNDVLQQHRMYLPAAPVLLAAVLGVWRLTESIPLRVRQGGFGALVVAAIAAAASATYARNEVYHRPDEVYCPADLSMGWGALARHALARQQWDEAEARLRAILALPEESFGVGPAVRRYHLGRAWNDLGIVRVGQQRWHDAEVAFERAAATLFDLPQAQHNLAVLRAFRGDTPSAKALLFPLVARGGPSQAIVDATLGAILLVEGRVDDAAVHLQRSLQIAPQFDATRRHLEIGHRPVALELAPLGVYDDAWICIVLRPL